MHLDNNEIAEEYFHNHRLIGINTHYEGYMLSNMLNKYFNFEFKRSTAAEIISYFQPKPKPDNLFSILGEVNNKLVEICFPLYGHIPKYSSAHLYLYTNKIEGYYLLEECKNGQLLLLIRNPEFLGFDKDILELIRSIKGITSAFEVDIPKIKSIQNLMW